MRVWDFSECDVLYTYCTVLMEFVVMDEEFGALMF